MQPKTTSPATRSKLPATHLIHRRTGKIARLPREARDLLNTLLRDGLPYALISQRLAEQGHKITQNNLSRWHTGGGYSDWLQEQSCLDEVRLRLDFANDLVQEKNVDLIDAASLRIAVTRLYTLLMTFEPSKLKSQMAVQPVIYTRILNALCKLTEASIRCERHRDSKLENAALFKTGASLFEAAFQKPATTAPSPSAPICSNLHQSAPNHG